MKNFIITVLFAALTFVTGAFFGIGFDQNWYEKQGIRLTCKKEK